MKTKNTKLLTTVATLSLLLSSCGGNNTPPHKHQWSEPTYTWADDYLSCTASRVCLKDSSHVETETAGAVMRTVNDETCTEDGLGNYVATFDNPAFETQYHEYSIPAHGHRYEFDSFVWEGYTAKAKCVCEYDNSHIIYYDAQITEEITTEPTCNGTGVKVYTATYLDQSDTKTEVLSSLGHDWGEPTYLLIGDDQMKASRVCSRDSSHVEEETVNGVYSVVTPATEESSGLGMYTFSFTNPAFETQTHEVIINKIVSGATPKLSADGKTVTYGIYPKTYISDSDFAIELEDNADYLGSGWYEYEGEYYAKVYAQPYTTGYKFDDGTTITQYINYWFKFEPITWNVLSVDDGKYLLVSDVLLDVSKYSYQNKNNYKNSTIRDYLNDEFLTRAFVLNDNNLLTTVVDNSAATTASEPNQYACENTEDKVFLLSYQDYTNTAYGFISSAYSETDTRQCVTTDYARAKGALVNTSNNYGYYWTRSPNSGNEHYASYVRTDGVIHYDNNTSYAYMCVRPAITITIN